MEKINQDYDSPWKDILEAYFHCIEIIKLCFLYSIFNNLNSKATSLFDVRRSFFILFFIDWVMSLPQEFSKRFWDNFISFEEEHKMPYVTSVEKIGIEKGMLLNPTPLLVQRIFND